MSALKARPARSTAQREGSNTDASARMVCVSCRSSTAAFRPKSDTRPSSSSEIFSTALFLSATPKPTCSM